MQNVNVTTSVTQVIAAGVRAGTLLLQNQSDTSMRLAVGEANIAALTADVGLALEPGDVLTLSGNDQMHPVSAIHGGSGDKVLHWQLF